MDSLDLYQRAIESFLSQYPFIRIQIENICSNEADALGLSLEEHRKNVLMQCIQEKGESQGDDDYLIRLAARSEKERISMILENRRVRADALGVAWAEYCEINPYVIKLEQLIQGCTE